MNTWDIYVESERAMRLDAITRYHAQRLAEARRRRSVRIVVLAAGVLVAAVVVGVVL